MQEFVNPSSVLTLMQISCEYIILLTDIGLLEIYANIFN